jgi:hypothetical protein
MEAAFRCLDRIEPHPRRAPRQRAILQRLEVDR